MVNTMHAMILRACALCLCTTIGCQAFSGRTLFEGSTADNGSGARASESPAIASYGDDNSPARRDSLVDNRSRDADRQSAGTESASTQIAAGQAAIRNKDYESAKSIFRRVLQVDGNNAAAHHQLAIVADLQKDFSEADYRYRQALYHGANYPELANLYSDMGYSYLLQGKLAQCQSALDKALSYDPSHRTATNNYGALYAKLGDRDRALAMFRKGGTEAQAQKYLKDLFPDTNPSQFASAAGPNTIDLTGGRNPNLGGGVNAVHNSMPNEYQREFQSQPTSNPFANHNVQPSPNGSFNSGQPSGSAFPNNSGLDNPALGRPELGSGLNPLNSNNLNNPNPLGTANAWPNGTNGVNSGGFPNTNGGLQPMGFNANATNPAYRTPNAHFGSGNSAAPNGNLGTSSNYGTSNGFGANNNSGANINSGVNHGMRSTVPGSLQPNPNAWAGNSQNGNVQTGSDPHVQAGMRFANPLPVNSNPGSSAGFPSTPLMPTGAGSMHGSQFQQAPRYQAPGQPRDSRAGGVDLTNRNAGVPGAFPATGASGQYPSVPFGGANPNGINSNMNGSANSFNTSAAQSALGGANNPAAQFDQQMQNFPSGQNTQLPNDPSNSNLGSFNNPATARY